MLFGLLCSSSPPSHFCFFSDSVIVWLTKLLMGHTHLLLCQITQLQSLTCASVYPCALPLHVSQPSLCSHHLLFFFCLTINDKKDNFLSLDFWDPNTKLKQNSFLPPKKAVNFFFYIKQQKLYAIDANQLIQLSSK